MNRNNIWFHIVIAGVLISFAAAAGQISRWVSREKKSEQSRTVSKTNTKPVAVSRTTNESEPEVLVKFKPNVSLGEIGKLTARNNDRVEDEIETVKGLVAIDDLDDANAEFNCKTIC